MSKVKKLSPLTLIETALRAIPVRDKYEELLFQGLQVLSLQEAEQYENFVSVEMNNFLRENWDHYATPHGVLIALFNQVGVAPRDQIAIRVPMLAAIIPFFDEEAWVLFDQMVIAELGSKSSQAVADTESAKNTSADDRHVFSSTKENVMNGYGKRGGTSGTAGKKAETIEAVIDGVPYSKRVFFGQRVLVVYFSDDRPPLVTAWLRQGDAVENAKGCEQRGSRAVIVAATVKEPAHA